MFDKLKLKLEPKAVEKPKIAKKTQTVEKPSAKPKKDREPEKTPDFAPQSAPVHADLQAAENSFVGIREYASAEEIEEHLDKQISQTKSALGEYLRQLDDVRGVAEKSKKLHDIVSKVSGKKQPKQSSEQLDVNGLEIVVDATPLHELDALESVLRSHQQRLLALQKAKEALEQLDSLGDTEGIRLLVLEKHGIPEQILLKIA
jgi:predicted metal-dependent hydrolase